MRPYEHKTQQKVLTYVVFSAVVILGDAMTIKDEKVLQWVKGSNFVNYYQKDIFDFKNPKNTEIWLWFHGMFDKRQKSE